jgi:hypothetical protein
LPTADGVGQDLVRFLDTLEEAVTFLLTSRGFLVGVVLEDLLAVGFLDLFVGGFEAVLG